ncbi:MAG: hypothetical protein A2X94_02350 [Bdellovibrionales bacterium GWB1_55_8]|nr:MAG: hypothetical protein A2X94_02350 [Bdellovibrionales bacterium GWB1_55_8]
MSKFEWIRTALGGIALGLALSPQVLAGETDLTVFHTNDLHSRLRAVRGQALELGGVARTATLLKRLRRGEPSLTLDAGDWSEGSWYFSVDAGSNVLRIMEKMGYDAAVLGDHDYLTGPDQTAKTILDAKVNFPILAANLQWPGSSASHVLRSTVAPYLIKEVSGVRVGIIGFTHATFMFDSFLEPVSSDSAIKIAAKMVRKMRKKVDLLIVVSHNEHIKNAAIAKLIPGIDLVVSGHSHEKTPEPRWIRNTFNRRLVPLVEAGEWGQFLGELKIAVDTRKKKVRFRSYRLHPVSSDLPEDPLIAKMVRDEDEKLSARFGDIRRVIARSDFEIRNDDGMRGGLAKLASRSYRTATGADLALEEVALTGSELAKGPLTLLDLHDVLPHLYNPSTGKEWTIRLWNARGRDLRLIFQLFYTTFGVLPAKWRPGWMASDNVSFTWNPGSLRSVKSLLVGGMPVDSRRRYQVALNEGLYFALDVANRKFRLKMDLSDSKDTGIEAWRAVADYAASVRTFTPETLCMGCDARVLGVDVAVPYYTLRKEDGRVLARAVNLGSEVSPSGLLSCSSGIPNGMAEFATKFQRWSALGQVAVPPLVPGESVELSLELPSSILDKSFVPLKCEAAIPLDNYLQNNSGTMVFSNY